jgi:NADPH:quinone reductase-like Zn-dependent oxidoreductase
VKPGQKVLINGAAGAVGSAAVQIARSMGAEVTATCSAANRELVLGLGAARVIDYAAEEVLKPGDLYDVIFDTQGTISPNAGAPFIRQGGVFLALLMDLGQMLQKPKGVRVVGGTANGVPLMPELATLVALGKIRAVIDSVLPFEQLPDAHRRVDGGHKRGNVVVRVAT